MKETDLYEPVKVFLEQAGYKVYPEVQTRHNRADIVAIHGNLITVVELKTSLSLDLISQAVSWRGSAHYIYAAVPSIIHGVKPYVHGLLRRENIGLLLVHQEYKTPWCEPFLRPILQRKITSDLTKYITPYHETDSPPGGHCGGGYITPYRITILKVKEYLSRRVVWCSMDEILNACETHYAQPKPSLSKALLQFEHDWCESCKMKGKLYFRVRRVK